MTACAKSHLVRPVSKAQHVTPSCCNNVRNVVWTKHIFCFKEFLLSMPTAVECNTFGL